MTDINKYREGYEAAKEEIAEKSRQGLAERFVKAVLSVPVEAVKDVIRNDDESKGRNDAFDGRPFNPGHD